MNVQITYDENNPSTYSDEELKSTFHQAKTDLEEASIIANESDWHVACFAATVILAQEMGRRGLRLDK